MHYYVASYLSMSFSTIVLADDHPLVREGIRMALQGLTIATVIGEVASGVELLPTVAKLQPDLLLLDVTMPDFEPIAAIHLLRQQFPQLKIIIVSAHNDDLYVQGFLQAGVQGYYLKDDSLRELGHAVERVLGGECWLSYRLRQKLLQQEREQRFLPQLSARQIELLSLLKQGLDNRGVAIALDVSVKTVENHLTRLYRVLDVQSRLEAVHYLEEHPTLLLGAISKVGALPAHLRGQIEQGVLVVDDNVRYRQKVCGLIGRFFPDVGIWEAGSIEIAMLQAEKKSLRLALVDVILGDEDGIRCVRQLKTQHPTLRIVLMSAYPDREFHRLGLQAGAVAFIDKKDLTGETLRQLVEDALM